MKISIVFLKKTNIYYVHKLLSYKITEPRQFQIQIGENHRAVSPTAIYGNSRSYSDKTIKVIILKSQSVLFRVYMVFTQNLL